MTDNITLPREVGEHLMWVLEECPLHGDWEKRDVIALVALREALAAPKQEFVAVVGMQEDSWKLINSKWVPPGMPIKAVHMLRDLPLGTPLYAAPSEDIEALTATRDRQAAMLRRLEEREAELDAEIGRLREELRQSSIDSTRAEVERLREALVRHGKHGVDCDAYRGCTCGLDAALRREDV